MTEWAEVLSSARICRLSYQSIFAAAVAHKLRPSLRLLGAAGLVPWLETLEAEVATDAQRQAATEALATGLVALLAALPAEIDN